MNCTCSAYTFPHRKGGGKCHGDTDYCPVCGKACDLVEQVEYESGGGDYPMPIKRYVSRCCGVE